MDKPQDFFLNPQPLVQLDILFPIGHIYFLIQILSYLNNEQCHLIYTDYIILFTKILLHLISALGIEIFWYSLSHITALNFSCNGTLLIMFRLKMKQICSLVARQCNIVTKNCQKFKKRIKNKRKFNLTNTALFQIEKRQVKQRTCRKGNSGKFAVGKGFVSVHCNFAHWIWIKGICVIFANLFFL